MKSLFKSLIFAGVVMNSYAPNMDVRIQYFDENQGVRIIDAYEARSTQKNLLQESSQPTKKWILRTYENGFIQFLDENLNEERGIAERNLPSAQENKTLVSAVLSYLIGNNSLKENYLNYDENRKKVEKFFSQVPTDRKKTAEKEMLKWKDRVQYDPINGLYQSMTFLNGFRGVTTSILFASYITNTLDYVWPFLFIYHAVVFFCGLYSHKHVLYLFNNKIPGWMEFIVAPKWHFGTENSYPNPFYVIFQKPKELDFDAFNTYLPLMSLCVGAKEEKELSNVKQLINSYTPNVEFKNIVESFRKNLEDIFQEIIPHVIKEESPRANGIEEEIAVE